MTFEECGSDGFCGQTWVLHIPGAIQRAQKSVSDKLSTDGIAGLSRDFQFTLSGGDRML